MQKSKLGISVGLLGAIIFMAALVDGYLAVFVAAGFVLLAEENIWLKRAAVKAAVLMLGFSVISVLIYIIPDIIDVVESFVVMFGADPFTGDFVGFINKLVTFLSNTVNLAEVIIFILLTFKALKQGTVVIPAVDKFINNHIA